MSSPESFQDKMTEELSQIKSSEQLDQLVGEITPEERAMLDSLDLQPEPIQDDSTQVDQDLVNRLVDKTLKRIHEEGNK